MSQDFSLYRSADVWDQEMQLGQKNLLRALCDFWPRGMTSALDVGCGDGKLTRVVAHETGIRIVGFDSSAEALSRLLLPAVQGDAAAMPFADASFDLVFSTDTLEHVPDGTHDIVWAELFRAARHHVLIAVPFREELLDATAKCSACGNTYHVNWHQRRYDIADIHRRTPLGWHVQSTVICGEPWPDVLPAETRLRRTILDQWSGWNKAVCPHCGARGQAPQTCPQLPGLAAVALGRQIYDSLAERRVWRSHSEILVIFGRTTKRLTPRLSQAMKETRLSTLVDPSIQKLHDQLATYPQVARCVKAVGGGGIIQFPVYRCFENLSVVRRPGTEDPVCLNLEDAFGELYSGLALAPNQAEAVIPLARAPVPGVYGVLLRIDSLDDIASVRLGIGPKISWFSPEKGKDVSYHRFGREKSDLYVQITDETWLDDSLLAPARHLPDLLPGDLIARTEEVSAAQQAFLRQELTAIRQKSDATLVTLQNLEAERDVLQSRARDAEQLAVVVQNLEAERDVLQSRAREAEQLAVIVQNLEAERDVIVQESHAASIRCADLQRAMERIQDRPEYKAGEVLRRTFSMKNSKSGKGNS